MIGFKSNKWPDSNDDLKNLNFISIIYIPDYQKNLP